MYTGVPQILSGTLALNTPEEKRFRLGKTVKFEFRNLGPGTITLQFNGRSEDQRTIDAGNSLSEEMAIQGFRIESDQADTDWEAMGTL